MEFQIHEDMFNPVYLPYLKRNEIYQIYYGGGSSGKSFFIAERLVLEALMYKKKTLCVRKVGNKIRDSLFAQITEIINLFQMQNYFKVPSSRSNNLTIDCKTTGSQFLFTGLDEVDKLNSIVGITDIWVEEAYEITQADFLQLDTRIRGQKDFKKRIIFSFNPVSARSWIKDFWFDNVTDYYKDNSIILKTTYRDNRFLSPHDFEALEAKKEIDPVFYNVYANGEWGEYSNIIFSNWKYVNFEKKFGITDLGYFDKVLYGMDFGYNDPNVLITVGVKFPPRPTLPIELFIFDEFYETKLTNTEFIKKVKDIYGNQLYGKKITCDSANPGFRIEWQQAGFKMAKANKGNGSIQTGISFLKSCKIWISERCPNTKMEFESYRYKTKDEEVLDEPIDNFNHAIDSIRYAVEDLRINRNRKIRKIRVR